MAELTPQERELLLQVLNSSQMNGLGATNVALAIIAAKLQNTGAKTDADHY